MRDNNKMSEQQAIKIEYQENLPRWLATRKYFAPSIPIGILASLQPRKGGIERDYALSPLMSFLNSQIALQKDLLGKEYYRAFLLVYYRDAATRYYRSVDEKITNVKQQADELQVSIDKIYDMSHKFATIAYNQAVSALDSCNQTVKMGGKDFSFD